MRPVIHGRDLEDVADDEDGNTKAQTPSPTPPVRRVRSAQGSDERSDGHERDQERLDDGLEGLVALWPLAETVDEIVEKQHAGDLAGV